MVSVDVKQRRGFLRASCELQSYSQREGGVMGRWETHGVVGGGGGGQRKGGREIFTFS